MKVYIVFHGRRNGSSILNNDLEEYIDKIFKSSNKAIDYMVSKSGKLLNEINYVEFNITVYPDCDRDYEFFRFEEHEVEEEDET